MRTNFLKRAAYWLFAAGIVFASCSDDNLNDVTGGGDDKTDNVPYEQGYLSMSFLNTANSSLRTLGANDTEPGIANESKVNNGLVVLYDASTDEVEYQFDLLELAVTPSPVPSSGIYTTEAREVNSLLTYKVAVFLNYTSALKAATAVGSDLADMQDYIVELTGGVTDFTGASSDNFLMCNYAGLVDVDPLHIKDTKNAAEANPVHVYVERAVAKVVLTLANTVSSTKDFAISDVQWQVDVLNKYSYWMRKQTKMLDFTSGSLALTEETLYTGLNPTLRDQMYAKDPNFEETSWEYWYNYSVAQKTPALSWTGYNVGAPTAPGFPAANSTSNYLAYMGDQYTYTTLTGITREAKTSVDTNNGLVSEWAYVPENTMVAEEQWEDATTSVLVTAVINPKKTLFSSTDNLASLSGAALSYFVYRDKVFLAADLKDIADDAANIASTGKSWAELVAVNPDLSEFQVFLQRADVKTAILGSATGDYVADAPTASVKFGALSFYAGGLNVYNIPIRHYSDALQPTSMAYGRYGVVRNNVYKLTLNAINNFGDINIPDKGEPDDKAKWLSVEFEILQWVIRTQGVSL